MAPQRPHRLAFRSAAWHHVLAPPVAGIVLLASNQPSRAHVTAWCACFRLCMLVCACYCIYVQYKSGVEQKSAGGRGKGNLGNLWKGIGRKALSGKDLLASVKR